MEIDLHMLREMPNSANGWNSQLLKAWIKYKIYITNVFVINCKVRRCNFTFDKIKSKTMKRQRNNLWCYWGFFAATCYACLMIFRRGVHCSSRLVTGSFVWRKHFHSKLMHENEDINEWDLNADNEMELMQMICIWSFVFLFKSPA